MSYLPPGAMTIQNSMKDRYAAGFTTPTKTKPPISGYATPTKNKQPITGKEPTGYSAINYFNQTDYTPKKYGNCYTDNEKATQRRVQREPGAPPTGDVLNQRGLSGYDVDADYSSAHQPGMAQAVQKLNVQKRHNNNIPYKMDMNYREVPTSTKDEFSPQSADYDTFDPDSPAARDIHFKYENDRIQNDLLDEICSDIGIKDSMDLDFFDFDTNPGQEIRIQSCDESLDETIVFSDLPELKGDFLDIGGPLKSNQVSSTTDIKGGQNKYAYQQTYNPYTKRFDQDNCNVPKSPAVPDSSGEDSKFNPLKDPCDRNPASVQSHTGSVDSMPESPGLGSPGKQNFLSDSCRTPTKGKVLDGKVSSSIGSPHVTSTCHRDLNVDDPHIAESCPNSPVDNRVNLTDDELFKKPFSPAKHAQIEGATRMPYQRSVDETTNLCQQQVPHVYNRNTNSPNSCSNNGQWQNRQRMPQGPQYPQNANNLQRVHEMSSSAPCLANDESLTMRNQRPGSNGPSYEQNNPGIQSGVPSFSTRSLDSPSEGYFSTAPSSVNTASSHYGSNSSLNSVGYGGKENTDCLNEQKQQMYQQGHLGPFKTGTDLVNRMRKKFAPVFGVDEQGMGQYNNTQGMSRKILPGPSNMNRMEYSPYARGPQNNGVQNHGNHYNSNMHHQNANMHTQNGQSVPYNMNQQQRNQYPGQPDHAMGRPGHNNMNMNGAMMPNGANMRQDQAHMKGPYNQAMPGHVMPQNRGMDGSPGLGQANMNSNMAGPPGAPMGMQPMNPSTDTMGLPPGSMGSQRNPMQPNPMQQPNMPPQMGNGNMESYNGYPNQGGFPAGDMSNSQNRHGFMQRLVMSDGSSAFRSHPLFPLLRDLIIADMNFHTPSFPFQLISNLPQDFSRLLQNYLNRNPPAGNYRVNEAVEGVIMDALKYAHSTLIEKIEQRKIQSQNQELPKHLSAIEDFCDRFDKAVRNTMNPVPQSHYGVVAGASIPVPPTNGNPPNRNPVAPPTPKKRRGEFGEFNSPLKPGSDGTGSCPGTPGSTKGDGPPKGKKHPVLPKEAVAVMLEWLKEHKDNPYPNDDEKQMLIQKTKLTINQINYWFTNARRRILPKWALQQYMEQQGYAESQSS